MRFIHSAGVTLLFKFSAMAFGLGTSIIIGRTLGPEGRGIYGLILTILFISSAFGIFGFGTANTFFNAKNKLLSRVIGINSLWVALLGTILTTAGYFLIYEVKPEMVQGLDGFLIYLIPYLIFLFLLGNLFSQALLGLNRIQAFNLFNFVEKFLYISCAVVFLVWLQNDLEFYMIIFSVLFSIFMIGYIFYYFNLSENTNSSYLKQAGKSFKYGIRSYIATFFTLLLLRSGVLFVNNYLGIGDAGQFAVAQQISELLVVIPSVIGRILFPRVAENNSADLTAQVLRTTVLLFAPIFLLIAIFSKEIIILLFGSEFIQAGTALLILLPGSFIYGLEVIISGDISGRGYPWPASLIWIFIAGLNITGYLILIPEYGINGAAISLSFSYFVIFVFMAFYLKHLTSLKFHQMFIPKKIDFIKLKHFSKNVLTKS